MSASPRRAAAEVHGRERACTATRSPRSCLLERQNHARELVRTEELGRWDALVVMSGDGLMHEVRPAPLGGGGEGRGGAFPGGARLRPLCSPHRW